MLERIRLWRLHAAPWAVAASFVAMGLLSLSCASAPAQATDATATPTAAPSGEQAPDPKPIPTAPPPLAEQASAPEPAATSTEQAEDDPPVGDCFGRGLSDDPLLCYVLEQADAQGLMDVLGLYVGHGERLYVSIIQDELTAKMYQFAHEKASAFIRTWPELLPAEKYLGFCHPDVREEYFPACLTAKYHSYTDLPKEYLHWYDLPRIYQVYIPPPSATYDPVVLLPGGDAGRRATLGWASWRQLWPAVASGASGASEASGTFDVSGVDMTNLPDATSEFGFAGIHGGGPVTGISYVQVKNPPTDEAALLALRRAVGSCYDNAAGVCTYKDWDGRTITKQIEFVTVKYSWEELNRWAEILNRFAVSSGNTLGITGARAHWNQDNLHAVFLHGLTRQVKYENPQLIRATIVVTVREDYERAALSMAELLPLLGIPVDAVGVVRLDDSIF